jgi:hypothetical protein
MDFWGKSEYLYLIKSGKYTKIGIATSCEDRIGSLQIGNPYELSLEKFFHVMDAGDVESALHAIYRKQRVRGEWYDLSAADIRKICKICFSYIKTSKKKKHAFLWSFVDQDKKKPSKSNAVFSTLRKKEIIREILDHGDSIIPYLAAEFGMKEKALRDEIAKIRHEKGI